MADGVEDGGADAVTDEEILYRSVMQEQYKIAADGAVTLHSVAFGDRSCRISFDRAKLRTAEQARKQPDQAIFAIRAGDARAIQGVVMNLQPYRVEVSADPLPENPAHALVQALPQSPDTPELSGEGFKKLQRELAKIARMELTPVRPAP